MRGNHQIDYIEIPVGDPAVAKTFFADLFGWTFEDYGPDYVSFNDGRSDGGFVRSEQRANEGDILIVFYSSELERDLKRVKSLGATITQDIFDFPGGRRFHFEHPDINRFAVWSEPAAAD
jgi:predicted enzyme related to lactoylglutathione lyase